MPVKKEQKEYLLEVFNKIIDILRNPSEIDILKLTLLDSDNSQPASIRYIKRKIVAFLFEVYHLSELPQIQEIKIDGLTYCLEQVIKVLKSFSNNNRLDSRSHEEAINKIKNNCDKYYPEINLRDLRKVFKEIETACVNTLQNEYTDYLFNLPPGI